MSVPVAPLRAFVDPEAGVFGVRDAADRSLLEGHGVGIVVREDGRSVTVPCAIAATPGSEGDGPPGAGASLTARDPLRGLELGITLECHPTRPRVDLVLDPLRNAGPDPIELERVVLLERRSEGGRLGFPDRHAGTRALFHGFQSWDGARLVDLDGGVDVAGHWLTAVAERRSGAGLVAGFLEPRRTWGRLRVAAPPGSDDLVLEAWLDFGGTVLASGESWGDQERLSLDFTADVTAGLEELAERIATACGARVASSARTGWSSWYQFYERVTPGDLLANLDFAAEHLRPFGLEVFQIDDGWQHAHREEHGGVGDWLETNAKFPQGLAELAGRIRQAGFVPGLWIAPFLVGESSRCRSERETALYEEPFGGPAAGFFRPWRGDRVMALDATRPLAEHHLEQLARTLTDEVGFDYLKIDFVFAGAGTDVRGNVIPHRRGDRRQSSMDAYRRGIEAIRRGMGEERCLLGCGAPQGPSIGVVDAMRISEDVHLDWNDQVATFEASALRWFGHGRLWWNDPDCVLVRPPLTLDEARLRASFVALSTGLTALSDDLPALDEERLDLLRRILPLAHGRARPVDWLRCERVPAVWHLSDTVGGRSVDVVGVFQYDDHVGAVRVEPRECDLPEDVDLLLFDYWNDRFLGRVRGAFELALRPRSCRVLAVVADRGEPTLLSSSRHVAQCLVGVDPVAREEQDGSLVETLEVDLVAGHASTLTHHVPAHWAIDGRPDVVAQREDPVEVSESTVALPDGEHLERVTLYSPRGGRVSMRISFRRASETDGGEAATTAEPAGAGLGLAVEQPAPGRMIVRWSASGSPTETEEQLLAQVRTSLATGTHVVFAPADPGPRRPAPLPPSIRDIVGAPVAFATQARMQSRAGELEQELVPAGDAPRFGVVSLGPEQPALALGVAAAADPAVHRLLVGPPRGGGLAFVLSPGDEAAEERCLEVLGRAVDVATLSDDVAVAWRAAVALPRADRFETATHPRLDDGLLDVGIPESETTFAYSLDAGGELVSVLARDGEPLADLGRRVSGAERLRIPVRCGGEPIGRRQLLIVRRTAPEDAGRLLRVMLGDEDLGPWRLGPAGERGHWHHDLFRIPSELFGDEESIELVLEAEEGEVTSYRYQLLLEDDPNGLWLTDLEPAGTPTRPVHVDRGPTGQPFVIGEQLYTRGLAVTSPMYFHYDVPDGYRWFETWVGLDRAAGRCGEVSFALLVDAEEQFRFGPLCGHDDAIPARVALPGACHLTLVCEGEAPADTVVFANPLLCRGED